MQIKTLAKVNIIRKLDYKFYIHSQSGNNVVDPDHIFWSAGGGYTVS